MQERISDRPDVIIFPPVILAATLVIASILQWLLPLGWLQAIEHIVRVPIGAAVILAGFCLAGAGRRLLVRLGTNVSPLRSTTALATKGVYKLTRNPLYSGGTLMMLGIAFIFALDWMVLLIVPSVLILHFGVVRREERYLERKFGGQYTEYKLQVPRYGMRIW